MDKISINEFLSRSECAFIYTKANLHMGDDLKTTFGRKQADVENGYAIWTFGNQIWESGREAIVSEYLSNGKDLYALMVKTGDDTGEDDKDHPGIRYFTKSCSDALLKQEPQIFEKLGCCMDSTNRYRFPDWMERVTHPSMYKNESCLAFVVEKFYEIEEGVEKSKLLQDFVAFRNVETEYRDGDITGMLFGTQSRIVFNAQANLNNQAGTAFVRPKDGIITPRIISGKNQCYVAKLKAPFIVEVEA